MDLNFDASYGDSKGYSSRRERYREDKEFRSRVNAVGLAGLTVFSVFTAAVKVPETVSGAYVQNAMENPGQFEPIAETLTDTADEVLSP